jgi:hypothetical protein
MSELGQKPSLAKSARWSGKCQERTFWEDGGGCELWRRG